METYSGTFTINSPVDPHAHLREPGTNKSETIASGTLAARKGGYQAVFDMWNNPGHFTVSEERIDEKQEIARRTSNVDIGFYAGIDLSNPDIDQIPRMIGRAAGLKLLMGKTTGSDRIYTLEDAKPAIDLWIDEARERGLHAPILLHAEGGIGEQTVGYIVRKDHHAHWCHLSSAKEAKAAGKFTKYYMQYFTSEATPHHLTMTDINAEQLGWLGGRMMPSLKKEADLEAVRYAFNRGDIQAVGTDHAPHPIEEKMRAERENPHGHTGDGCVTCFGVSGIEFALPILMRQVKLGHIAMDRLEDAMYAQPLRMLGIPQSQMRAKTTLEFEDWRIGEKDIVGGSENTPYIGRMAAAKVVSMTGRRRKPKVFEAQQIAA